jgi:hypothetical protein
MINGHTDGRGQHTTEVANIDLDTVLSSVNVEDVQRVLNELSIKIEKILEVTLDTQKAAKFLLNEVKGYENKSKKHIWDVMSPQLLSLILHMEACGMIDRKRTRKLVEEAFGLGKKK